MICGTSWKVFCCSALPKCWVCMDVLYPLSAHIYFLPLLLVLVSDNLTACQHIWIFKIFAVAADIRSAFKCCTQSSLCLHTFLFVCAEKQAVTNTHRHASCGEHGCWFHMEGCTSVGSVCCTAMHTLSLSAQLSLLVSWSGWADFKAIPGIQLVMVTECFFFTLSFVLF